MIDYPNSSDPRLDNPKGPGSGWILLVVIMYFIGLFSLLEYLFN